VGASPELLVARRGPGELPALRRIGAASPDPETDAANGAALAASGKNRHEHQLVVDTMRAALEPLCSDLDVAAQPQLTAPGAVASVHPDPRHAARNLHHRIGSALALHPTPAVGGVPTAAAVDLIAEIEGDRGFYAGAVGWCDARGDGRWVVAIRGASVGGPPRGAGPGRRRYRGRIRSRRRTRETTTKFRTILSALGVEQ
jgi:isochorismate synthase